MINAGLEIWKAIPNFPDFEVSDHGRVRRATDHARLSTLRAGTEVPRWIIKHDFMRRDGSATPQRYYCVTIRAQNRSYNKRVHRLVAEAFLPPGRPDQKHVAHNNGNSLDNRADNLRWATPSENQSDRLRHGTSNAGSRHGMARINEDIVRMIKSDLAAGFGVNATAKKFSVSQPTISMIKAGKTWRSAAKDAAIKQIASK